MHMLRRFSTHSNENKLASRKYKQEANEDLHGSKLVIVFPLVKNGLVIGVVSSADVRALPSFRSTLPRK